MKISLLLLLLCCIILIGSCDSNQMPDPPMGPKRAEYAKLITDHLDRSFGNKVWEISGLEIDSLKNLSDDIEPIITAKLTVHATNVKPLYLEKYMILNQSVVEEKSPSGTSAKFSINTKSISKSNKWDIIFLENIGEVILPLKNYGEAIMQFKGASVEVGSKKADELLKITKSRTARFVSEYEENKSFKVFGFNGLRAGKLTFKGFEINSDTTIISFAGTLNWGKVLDSATGDIFHYEVHPVKGKLYYLIFELQESFGNRWSPKMRNYAGVLDAGNKIEGGISGHNVYGQIDFRITF